MRNAASRIGKRGTLVIPAPLRKKFRIEEGSLVIAEEHPEGILIKPAVALPIEIYTKERKAEFLLANAVDEKDRTWAEREIRKLGLDPERLESRLPRP